MTENEILDAIDDACSPDIMSKSEAIEFMNGIISDLEIRVEAMEQELDG